MMDIHELFSILVLNEAVTLGWNMKRLHVLITIMLLPVPARSILAFPHLAADRSLLDTRPLRIRQARQANAS
jgi:hypothetical protein